MRWRYIEALFLGSWLIKTISGEDSRFLSENNEQNQENRLKFCIKIKKEIWTMYLLQTKFLSIFYHQKKNVASGESYKISKINTPK